MAFPPIHINIQEAELLLEKLTARLKITPEFEGETSEMEKLRQEICEKERYITEKVARIEEHARVQDACAPVRIGDIKLCDKCSRKYRRVDTMSIGGMELNQKKIEKTQLIIEALQKRLAKITTGLTRNPEYKKLTARIEKGKKLIAEAKNETAEIV
jgi:hypothetical protein